MNNSLIEINNIYSKINDVGLDIFNVLKTDTDNYNDKDTPMVLHNILLVT